MEAFGNVVGVRFSPQSSEERADRVSFLKEEANNLREWSKYYEDVWGSELVTSFGETDEGEQWFSVSQEKNGLMDLLASVFIEKGADGSPRWNYYCGPRDKCYEAASLEELIKCEMPDGMFEDLIKNYTSWGRRENVVQFI